YRPYMQGDNLRHVDWKVWGRTDELYVKQFEDDTNLRCHILVDTSASMNFGAINKFSYARMLAAALAYLMARQHDAPGLVLFNETARQVLPPRGGFAHVEELHLELARAKASGRAAWTQRMAGLTGGAQRRGVAVVISDLLSSVENVVDMLQQLQAERQEVVLFHIVAPEELELPTEGRFLMQDAETGEQVSVDASTFREEFQQRVQTFYRSVQQGCEGLEVDYERIRTDQPLDVALTTYLERRQQV
ncbi:MAG: hypothetical protein JWO95_1042, partial [Verrucomicrobiales bacterium]|nr:hypothetical protein [Verrucomicrobiales bacterium]